MQLIDISKSLKVNGPFKIEKSPKAQMAGNVKLIDQRMKIQDEFVKNIDKIEKKSLWIDSKREKIEEIDLRCIDI